MKIFKTDGTIDENAAGEYAYTVMNPAVIPCWEKCPEGNKTGWRSLGATIAARVRQELEEIHKGREAKALETFARTVFNDCHPDCKTTIIEATGTNYRRSLIAAINSMADKIESQKKYIGEQGQRIKDCRANEIETLRETNRRLEDELANTRGAFSRAAKRGDELEKTSALWCERFLASAKANTEIGMMLVEMMVRHGVEPPANEQEAVAARETRQPGPGIIDDGELETFLQVQGWAKADAQAFADYYKLRGIEAAVADCLGETAKNKLRRDIETWQSRQRKPEPAAVAGSETRKEPDGFMRVKCRCCRNTGWNGEAVKDSAPYDCMQCNGAGYVLAFIPKRDEVKAK